FLELRKTGAGIHLPCVNNSDAYTNIRGNDVYMGFIHIKSLQQEMVEHLLQQRENDGPYLSLVDFIERTAITKEQLNMLVSVGALRFTGKTKKQLLWEANFLQAKIKSLTSATPLFHEAPVNFTLPQLDDRRLDDLYDQIELLDFPLANPFEMLEEDPDDFVYAEALPGNLGKVVTSLGYYIEQKGVRTIRNETMAFASFLDARLNWLDTVHFPPSLRQYPLRGKGFYKITGKVVVDFGVYNIEVTKLIKLGIRERSWMEVR
ncbi:MAG: DNA polymerase III subunit alpha, partial [Ferruginibacter sp.]